MMDNNNIEHILIKYPKGDRGFLIPLLQEVQQYYGYILPYAVDEISDFTGVSPGEIFGVVTFYSQFYLEPRGKHVLKLCDGTACHVKGTSTLMTAVEDEFGINPGETTDDGQLTIEVVYCMGSCALAPVAVLDNQVMGRMRQETLLGRVKKQIGAG